MKNALILHGTANTSAGNWFPWLGAQLQAKGFTVWCPDLPGADHPDLDRYAAAILSNTTWQFTEDSIIVGHSSGGTAGLKLLQRLPKETVIHACFTVSSSFVKHGADPIEGLMREDFQFDVIKEHAKHFVVFHSDDDPYVPIADAHILSERLSGELIVIRGQGHFNLEKGPQYRQFPKLLETILAYTP